MSIVEGYRLVPMVGDPDDHRPASDWATIVDPGGPEGRVTSLALIVERIGAGDRIPLHRHPIDELILIDADGAEVRLGETRRTVGEGTVFFIPAGVAHGIGNPTAIPLPIRAVFASMMVGIEYLERNPAPGTESGAPQPPLFMDLRDGESL
jgi:quercetin dioxygenase-like cupin family protein